MLQSRNLWSRESGGSQVESTNHKLQGAKDTEKGRSRILRFNMWCNMQN